MLIKLLSVCVCETMQTETKVAEFMLCGPVYKKTIL